MFHMFQFLLPDFYNPNFAVNAFNLFWQSLAVSIVVTTIGLASHRSAAVTRHLIWFGSLLSLLLLPLIMAVNPLRSYPLFIIRIRPALGEGPTMVIFESNLPVDYSAKVASKFYPSKPVIYAITDFDFDWVKLYLSIWLTGTVWIFGKIFLDQLALRRLRRTAHALKDLEWLVLLNELRGELSISHPVSLWQSEEDIMPGTWGILHPAIILPPKAATWSLELRRVVLQHELAHIRRRDFFTQLWARFICAFYWFNPLVWLAARRLRVEQERACDDIVLGYGSIPSSYANHLVEIARSFRPMPAQNAIAVARTCQLNRRITAVLDCKRARRLKRGRVLAAGILMLGTIVMIGGLKAQIWDYNDWKNRFKSIIGQ